MITRIATLSLLLGVAAAAPSSLQRRFLEDENYFCDCPCDDDNSAAYGSALVWVDQSLSITDILDDAEYLTQQDVITGEDEDGNTYQGFCLEDMDAFDLLYDYGDQVFCDDECEGDDEANADGYVDKGDTLEDEAGDYFDFSSSSNSSSSDSLDSADKSADLADGVLDGVAPTSDEDLDAMDGEIDGTADGFSAFMNRETTIQDPPSR